MPAQGCVANSRNCVYRSRLRAAAISWVIACGMLFGGAGALGGALAAADSDAVGSSHGGRDDTGGSTSNDDNGASGGRAEGRGTGRASAGQSGSVESVGPPRRPPGRAVAATDPTATDPTATEPGDWPWPWPPCKGPHGARGTPRGSVGSGGGPKGNGGGGSGGGLPPTNFPPPALPGQPGEPAVADSESGAVTRPVSEPGPITMPPVIGLPAVEAPPLRLPSGPGPAPESAPGVLGNPVGEPTAGREPIPASPGRTTAAPESFRLGYPEYLREAKIGDVAVLALPGFAGIIALTALGGFVGYRQAKSGHVVRAAGTTRFLQ